MKVAPQIPTAVWSGTFRVLGVDLRCHVLDNGQRVIDNDSVAEVFATLSLVEQFPDVKLEMEAFARWIRGDAGVNG